MSSRRCCHTHIYTFLRSFLQPSNTSLHSFAHSETKKVWDRVFRLLYIPHTFFSLFVSVFFFFLSPQVPCELDSSSSSAAAAHLLVFQDVKAGEICMSILHTKTQEHTRGLYGHIYPLLVSKPIELPKYQFVLRKIPSLDCCCNVFAVIKLNTAVQNPRNSSPLSFLFSHALSFPIQISEAACRQ